MAPPRPSPTPAISATLGRAVMTILSGFRRLTALEPRRAEQVLAPLRIVRRRPVHVSQHRQPAYDCGALVDRVKPAFYVRILLYVHALLPVRAQPGHDRDVGDRVLAAGDILALGQPPVEHSVKPVRLPRV